jgi:hypothetical protein
MTYASVHSSVLLSAPESVLAGRKAGGGAALQPGAGAGVVLCSETEFPAGPCAGAGRLRKRGISDLIVLYQV